MGEPRPGDFPDPINVRTANILLKDNQIGKAGDYARFNTSGTRAWEVITAALIPNEGIVGGEGIVQLQQEVNSTGFGDAIVNAGAFGVGSWFYGKSNGVLEPNDYVVLANATIVGEFGWVSVVNIANPTGGADSGTDAIITFSTPHNLTIGDVVVLTNWSGGGDYNGTFGIIETTSLTITVHNAAVTGASTSTGEVKYTVTANKAQAQYIKKSGETFISTAVDNDICVFSMLKGGQSIA